MKLSLNRESAEALRELSQVMGSARNRVAEDTITLLTVFQQEQQNIGVHGDDVNGIVQHIRAAQELTSGSLTALSGKLQETADKIEDYVRSIPAVGPEPGAAAGTGSTVAAQIGSAGGRGEQPARLLPDRTAPRSLAATQFGYSSKDGNDFTYDSPLELDLYLYKKQGSADPAFQGTCGLCSCANILRMAGVSYSEADMIRYASKTEDEHASLVQTLFGGSKLCMTGQKDPGDNGGTSPQNRQDILRHFGMESDLVPVSFGTDGAVSDQTMRKLADFVDTGHGVILSVHADVLWFDQAPGMDDLHAITVTSVTRDGAGNVMGFHVCDSANGGTAYYPVDKLREALSGAPMNVTRQIIR